MQRLRVVPRLWGDLASGRKRATIRWREGRIAPGRMLCLCGDGSGRSLEVVVDRVSDMPLREAAGFLGRSAEWPDDVMLAGMREHYPEIGLGDVVQVVEHGPPLAPVAGRG